MTSIVDRSLAEATVIDRAGYPYVIHPLTDGVPRVPPALLAAWVEWAASRPVVAQATLLMAPEAMAFPLVAPLSLRTGLPYALARKRAYGQPGEVRAVSRTGYGESPLYLNGLAAGDQVVVVDDVLSTGNTLGALLRALQSTPARVVGAVLFLDKGTSASRLEAEFGVPIHAMRRVQVAGGKLIPVA
ncbi:MAG: adenine phosphoribosyltransferase [Thermoplasmatota archaeon]